MTAAPISFPPFICKLQYRAKGTNSVYESSGIGQPLGLPRKGLFGGFAFVGIRIEHGFGVVQSRTVCTAMFLRDLDDSIVGRLACPVTLVLEQHLHPSYR